MNTVWTDNALSVDREQYQRDALNVRRIVDATQRGRKGMSYAYRQRKKAIKRLKRERGEAIIPLTDFRSIQAAWQREIDGWPICTLEQIVNARGKV